MAGRWAIPGTLQCMCLPLSLCSCSSDTFRADWQASLSCDCLICAYPSSPRRPFLTKRSQTQPFLSRYRLQTGRLVSFHHTLPCPLSLPKMVSHSKRSFFFSYFKGEAYKRKKKLKESLRYGGSCTMCKMYVSVAPRPFLCSHVQLCESVEGNANI